MASSWADIAHNTIRRTHDSLPEDLPFKDRMAAIDASYPFGERKNWPYKAWLAARKAYMARYDDRKPPGPLFAESPLERAKRKSMIAGEGA